MEIIERTKIQIPVTLTDKIFEVFGILILVSFWIFTLNYFKQLPEIIPTHFRMNGEADGFGSKWFIFGLPIIGTALYIVLSILSKYPNKMNYSVTITEENAEKLYAIMTQMLRVMKVCLVIVFFNLEYKTVQLALDFNDIFGKWSLVLDLSLIFIPLFYFLIKFSKNS